MYNTVLITGAAKRIGENLALHFAKNGWNIAIHFNKSASSAKKLKNTIQSYGVDCITIKADLSNLNQIKNILRKIKKKLGSLNCIINNASIFENDDILNFTDKNYQKHQNVNFLAPVLLSREFAKMKGHTKLNSVINILDQRVFKLTPYFFSYTISKTSLMTFTKVAAMKFAPHIRVNGVAPGPTLKNVRQSNSHFNKQGKNTLLKTKVSMDDICKTVYLLANSESITGQVIAVDSGQSLNFKTPDLIGVKE